MPNYQKTADRKAKIFVDFPLINFLGCPEKTGTELSRKIERFIILRSWVFLGRVPSFSAVEDFDLIKETAERLVSVLVPEVVHPFGLGRSEETLGNRIIVTIAFAAHAAPDVIGSQQLLIIAGAILAAAIRVVHRPVGRLVAAQGHNQGIDVRWRAIVKGCRKLFFLSSQDAVFDAEVSRGFGDAVDLLGNQTYGLLLELAAVMLSLLIRHGSTSCCPITWAFRGLRFFRVGSLSDSRILYFEALFF